MKMLNLKTGKSILSFGILGPNDITADPWIEDIKIDGLILNKVVDIGEMCEDLVRRCERAVFLVLNEVSGCLNEFFLKCPGRWRGLFINNVKEGEMVLEGLDCSSGLSLIVSGSPGIVCDLKSFLNKENLKLVKIKVTGGIFNTTEILLGAVIRELTAPR